jgi:hypothetical protein
MSVDEEVDEALRALRGSVTRLLVPIQTTRVVDESAFAEVHAHALHLVRLLKHQTKVPKTVLVELHGTFHILRAEAPYLRDEKAVVEEMATKIERCFGMVLGSEVPEDRIPGLPRII